MEILLYSFSLIEYPHINRESTRSQFSFYSLERRGTFYFPPDEILNISVRVQKAAWSVFPSCRTTFFTRAERDLFKWSAHSPTCLCMLKCCKWKSTFCWTKAKIHAVSCRWLRFLMLQLHLFIKQPSKYESTLSTKGLEKSKWFNNTMQLILCFSLSLSLFFSSNIPASKLSKPS